MPTNVISGCHNGATTAIATADATSEATSLTLSNAINAALVAHFADGTKHGAADTVMVASTVTDGAPAYATRDVYTATPRPVPVNATDPGAVRGNFDSLRTAYNLHVLRGDIHYAQDLTNQCQVREYAGPNTVAAYWAYLNTLKANINAHFASTRA